MDQMDHLNGLTERIIGCAIEVHRHLGPGLFESIYGARPRHRAGHRRCEMQVPGFTAGGLQGPFARQILNRLHRRRVGCRRGKERRTLRSRPRRPGPDLPQTDGAQSGTAAQLQLEAPDRRTQEIHLVGEAGARSESILVSVSLCLRGEVPKQVPVAFSRSAPRARSRSARSRRRP